MTLKKSDIEKFKKRLLDIKNQINTSIQEVSEDVKSTENKGYSQHQADEGTDTFVQSISMEISNKDLSVLRQVERALEKIDEGTYGICDVTGKEIPITRLEAIPYANMTVEAQEKLEKGLL